MEPTAGIVVLPIHKAKKHGDQRENQCQNYACPGSVGQFLGMKKPGNEAEDKSAGYESYRHMRERRMYRAGITKGGKKLIESAQHTAFPMGLSAGLP